MLLSADHEEIQDLAAVDALRAGRREWIVLAVYATSRGLLIGARALLGVAGATLAPSTLSLIRNMFADPRQRTVAISVWVTSFSAGGAIGPLLGGVLLEWRARCSAASSPNL